MIRAELEGSSSVVAGSAGSGWLVLELDRVGPVPLYHQIAEHIRHSIGSGDLVSSSQLGNEIALAEQFGVSRPTVRRALKELVDQGLLVRRRGVGTQVVQDRISRPLKLTNLFDELAQDDKDPNTQVLVMEVRPPSAEVAARLKVDPDEPVLRVRRLRMAGGQPLAILENFLPGRLGHIAGTDLESVGLYQTLRQMGVRMRVANQRIGAREGTDEECRLLGEPPLSPVMTMDRLTHEDSGLPVEWGRHVYRASRYEYTVTLVRR